MKYIMIETADGEKLPFIFPDRLVHRDVADIMKRIVAYHDRGSPGKSLPQIASAGFVEFPALPTVAGESESLGSIKSNPLDAFRIQAGSSVSHMPDALLVRMMDKLVGSDDVPHGYRRGNHGLEPIDD